MNDKKKAKAKAAGKNKPGMVWDRKAGKFRRATGAEKKIIKKRVKLMHRGGAIRKALKSRKKFDCKDSGTKVVKEGFDLATKDSKFSLEAGDILTYAGLKVTVSRGDKKVVEGVEVSEDFIDRCLQEEVLGDAPSACESAAVLSYNTSKGFVFVKEGSEVPLGNRIRARAFLISEGYKVDSSILDKACAGEVVTL